MNKNMKIGILTIHQSVNFGATLQAFATNRFLRKNGLPAEIANYRQPSCETNAYLKSNLKASWKNDKNHSRIHRAKLALSLGIQYPSKARRYHRFDEFRANHMQLSKPCKTAQELATVGYTHYVCGSDQIWNMSVVSKLDTIYFGDIPGDHQTVAYAASMGNARYSPANLALATMFINRMTACGVRERDMCDYFQPYVDIPVTEVLDPVFLLEREDYEEIMSKKTEKRPYVLLYTVQNNPEALRIANKTAEKLCCELIKICANKSLGEKHRQVCDIGPEEFLRYFADASYVVTNSFHGTAFSLIFEKQLTVIDNKERGSRICNLLHNAGLSNRMVEKYEEIGDDRINYEEVHRLLKPECERSRKFLLDALGREL